MPAIPDALRLLADFPLTYGPEPPPGAPVERIRDGRFTLLLIPGPSGQLVEALDLGADVAATVADVRDMLRGRGRDTAVWFVARRTRPEGVLDALRACGLEAADGPQWEPRFSSMLLLEPPAAGPPDVVARMVDSYEEFAAAAEFEEEVFQIAEEDRSARAEQRRALWEMQLAGDSPVHIYVALLDGEIVGMARSLLADIAVNLSGGAVRPDVRGRGVYRALVRARWDDSVARGTPALTVQAGRMSRPVLERLGFETVSEQDCLLDRFASSPAHAT